MSGPQYLGFDLSTQQLKAVVVESNLKLVHEAIVSFDKDLSKWATQYGVLSNKAKGEIYAPVAMWLEALDLVLSRLKEQGLNFARVKGVSGAGMQHGTVFWSHNAESLLSSLQSSKCLAEQLGSGPDSQQSGAFSSPFSPNWQDASTQKQCEEFDKRLGDEETLAYVTGSKAHHRFSGPQILKFRQENPEGYRATSRISLVSSFLPSVLLGKLAPIDIGDVCGMNLWDIPNAAWHEDLLALTAGDDGVADLQQKLGDVRHDGGGSLGTIAPYFQERYGFGPTCSIAPFTGDNPATILSLPLRPSDAMVSLGTSTTFLMSTPHYKPSPAYHFMNHPTTPGLYMFMLCYKNGSLAREQIRDALNAHSANDAASKSWDLFNAAAASFPPLGQPDPAADPIMHLSLFFPLPEIVPNTPAGKWHFTYTPSDSDSGSGSGGTLAPAAAPEPPAAARAILESQFLSLRLRSAALVTPTSPPPQQQEGRTTDQALPAQPRRVYVVGGASQNVAIVGVAGAVLGGAEGVFALDVGGNACALGAAYKAVWAVERSEGETLAALVETRWREDAFVRRVDGGYRKGMWERYGEALKGFEQMEAAVVERVAEEERKTTMSVQGEK